MITAAKALDFPANRLIDFHTHILPEMDDGSKSVGESLRMIEQSVRQGVCCIVLTPHFYATSDDPVHFLEKRSRSLRKLKQAMRESLPLLIPGAEVHYFSGITAMEEITALCIDQTNLLLLEMPFKKWSTHVLDDVLELNNRKNLRIVVAHIERYIQEQPKGTLEYLVRNRVLIQANAEYFMHFLNRRKALQLLENGWIHLVGSDCHNLDSRPPCMGECYQIIRSRLGDETAERIQKNAFQFLLHGQKPLHFDPVKADEVLL